MTDLHMCWQPMAIPIAEHHSGVTQVRSCVHFSNLTVLIGPANSPLSTIRRTLAELRSAGFQLNLSIPSRPTVSLELPPKLSTYDNTLISIFDRIEHMTRQSPSLGMALLFERPLHVPPPSITTSLLVAGQLRIHRAFTAFLSGHDPRIEPLASEADWLRWHPSDRAPCWFEYHSSDGGRHLALSTLRPEALSAMKLSVAAFTPKSAFPQHQADRLHFGSHLKVHVVKPADTFVYALRLRNGRWDLPWGEDPVSPPLLRLVFDARGGSHYIAALVTDSPLPGLAAAFESLEDAASPDGRIALCRLFWNFHHRQNAPFTLLLSREYPVEQGRPNIHPAIDAVVEALDNDNFQAAEQLAEELAADLPAGLFLHNVQLHLGIARRRQALVQPARAVLESAYSGATQVSDLSCAASAARELGRLCTDLGDFSEARIWLLRALEGHESAHELVECARDQINLGWLEWNQQRFAEGLAAYSAAIEPVAQAEIWRLQVAARQGVAQCLHDLGELELARTEHSQALAMASNHGDRHGEMRAHGDMGLLALDLGEPLQAAEHFQRQLALATEMGNINLKGLSLINLARTQQAVGALQQAAGLLEEALRCLPRERNVPRLFAAIILACIAREQGRFSDADRWIVKIEPGAVQNHAELSWRFALERAELLRVTDQADAERVYVEGICAVERFRDTLPQALRRSFLRASTALFDGWIDRLQARDADPLLLAVAIERSRARAFLAALTEAREDVAIHKMQKPENLDRPREDLGSLDGLIQYTYHTAVTLLSLYALEDRALWLVVRAGEVACVCVKVSRGELLEQCASVRRDIEEAMENGRLATGRSFAHLSESLLRPLLPYLVEFQPGRALGLCVPPFLYGIPLHALPLPQGHPRVGEPLITVADVFLVPSLSALGYWLTLASPPGKPPVVIIDSLGDLPGSHVEAQAIQRCFPDARVYAGVDATPKVLQVLAPSASMVHLAVHGRCTGTAGGAVLRFHPGTSSSESEAIGLDSHPPRSGQTRTLAGEVGIAQILSQRYQADVVVLSVCHGGAGALTATGEGAMELLSWAFLEAGARSVVASFWQVPDAETGRFMSVFYESLALGSPRVSALAHAMRECRNDHVWMAFTLLGDWRALSFLPSSGDKI